MENHREEVNKLARSRISMIKKALWKGASVMLRERGYEYSPEQCSIKWKNLKRLYKVKLFFLFFFLTKSINAINFDKFNCLI